MLSRAPAANPNDQRGEGHTEAHAGSQQLHNIHTVISRETRLLSQVAKHNATDDQGDNDGWYDGISSSGHGCLLQRRESYRIFRLEMNLQDADFFTA